MPELHLKLIGDMLETRFGDYSATAPWSDIASLKLTKENAYTYGRDLFELVTQHEQLRNTLTHLPRNTRIVLLAEQAEVAAIHWEYMRLSDGTLLAARHNLVRGIPESQRREQITPVAPLNIVALPVSPLNESRILNTEGEWKMLTEMVKRQGKALTLTRVRPPTLGTMMGATGSEGTTIVQFMGHSNVGVLLFENEFGNAELVSEQKFVNALDGQPYLVIMNSCYSAVSSRLTFNGEMLRETDSHLGNIARSVVLDGIPYALGMQFALYDYIALKITDYFYEFLLKSNNVEDAVRKTRARLEDTQFPFEAQGNEQLPTSHWLAGVPVLYTNQSEASLALPLSPGGITLHPDLGRTSMYNLDKLPQPDHFTGRGKEIHETLELFSYFEGGFIVLHGLGGIGKTALARSIAERVSYRYDDRVLAYSFETFTRSDNTGKDVVNEQFAGTFYSTLADYYELDAKDYQTVRDLQQAIINQRRNTRSLLILDNMETLISKQRDGDVQANELASFVRRLKEDRNVVLLTSRYTPPADWGDVKEIKVRDLDDADGARLFFTSISEDRRTSVTGEDCLKLSRHVGGHPLSIRLLAGSFSDDSADTLATFLKNIEREIPKATQKTASSSEDAQRQQSIDACMHYSIRRLTDEQKKVLYTVGIFLAPFLPEWAEDVLEDEEQTRKHLQDLERLGLLESNRKDFEEGYIILYEMHPMLRQHIKKYISLLNAEVRESYGLVYKGLVGGVWTFEDSYGSDLGEGMRYLVLQSFTDCEAILKDEAISLATRSSIAYYLAQWYERKGQRSQALALYKQSQTMREELDDTRGIEATQLELAYLLTQRGEVNEAMKLYRQLLRKARKTKNINAIATVKFEMANLLEQTSRVDKAMNLFQQSLVIYQAEHDERNVAVTLDAIARLLAGQGKVDEAIRLYDQALAVKKN